MLVPLALISEAAESILSGVNASIADQGSIPSSSCANESIFQPNVALPEPYSSRSTSLSRDDLAIIQKSKGAMIAIYEPAIYSRASPPK